jgi:tRNA A-37 threonylcarbamoyl transferase component Bud32
MDLALQAEGETVVETPPENSCATHTGRVFGNYDVLEQIGQGGMGVVYRARQRGLGRVVALKLLLAGSRATEAEIKRFHTEAKAAATLKHPHVVAIHEVGEHEGQHYFSMDYVEGQSLAEVIRRTPLPAARAARYVKIIAEAIHYAHERGILHRDLKPHNVLIDAQDEPRITDFGLARQIDVESDLTISGAVLGTPSYMPPEQAAGNRREIGRASDVYSLGAILYDLLTGRPPFRAETPLDTLRQVIDTDPAPPRLMNRKVPRDLETICLKCLAKEPAQRYATAHELAEDLGRFLRQEPIHARPVSSVGRVWRWSRRQPALAGLAGAVGVLFLLLGVAAFILRHDVGVGVLDNAQAKAGWLAGELLRLRLVVHDMASSPELAKLITANDLPALRTFLAGRLAPPNANLPSWIRGQNWVIMTNGWTMLRWPVPEHEQKRLQDRSARDYYAGALARVGSNGVDLVHISQFYRSAEDDHYKFGASEVVRDAEGTVVGVLALMLRPVNLAQALGTSNDRTKTAIFGVWDQSTELNPDDAHAADRATKPEFVIWYHPELGTNNVVEPASHRFLPELLPLTTARRVPPDPSGAIQTRMDWLYHDPIARRQPELTGIWLGAFARVPDTPFVVLSESRDRVADAFATALLLTVLAALCFLGWRSMRMRAKARKQGDES